MDCQCKECRAACRDKPGWFLPGEAEKAAALLGMSLEGLFTTKLGVDHWVDKGGDILVLSPAVQGMVPGTRFPSNPRGRCVFYVRGLCEIHAAKPHECAELGHGIGACHEETAIAWLSYQEQCTNLLNGGGEHVTTTA